jgi:hypothetical protein
MRGDCKFVTMEFDGVTTKNVGEELVEKIPASVAGLADDAFYIGMNAFRSRQRKPGVPQQQPEGPKGKIYRDEDTEAE